MSKPRERIAFILAGLSVLAGAILFRWSASQDFAAQGIAWPAGYLLIAAQEVLLFGLPALAVAMSTVERRSRLSSSMRRPPLMPTSITLLLGATYPLASILVIGIWVAAMTALGLSVPMDAVSIVPKSIAEFLAALAAAGIIPAVCEELLFRGVLLGGLQRRLGSRAAIIVTSVLFAVLHMNVLGLPALLLLSVLLGVVRVKFNSLILPMLLHAVYNALVLTLNALNAQPGGQAIVVSVLVCGAAIALLVREKEAAEWN